jgi:hypothetical protein
MPKYLYHATPKSNADSIAKHGLKPRSVGGKVSEYLCMSGSESGARTLGGRANDIIFRVKFSSLNASSWSKTGAGKDEWRSTEDINADHLEYRRNLGTPTQRTWRKAKLFPTGV